MADQIVVLDGYVLNPGDLSWDELAALGKLTVHDRTPEDLVIARAKGHAVVLTNKTPLTAPTIEALPGLRYIGVMATGYDVVDLAAAAERGITVTNVPSYGTDSVAQHAMTLALELLRQPALHSRAVHEGKWATSPDWCFALSPIVELTGKVMGIVGFGKIGLTLARIGAAFGMSIIAHDEYPRSRDSLGGLDVKFVSVDELFASADVISLHCPLTPSTYHLVDARRLALMRPTAILINTSRGQLIDNQALADALAAGKLFGAGLDVLDVEPPPANHPLLSAPNCIITPHIAWYAKASRQRLLDQAVANVRAFLAGQPTNVLRRS